MSIEYTASGQLYTVTAATAINNIFASGASLCAWVNPDSSGFSTTIGRVLDKFWLLHFDNNLATNSYSFEHVWSGDNGRWSMPDSTADFGEWHHIAVSYDGGSTSNDPVLYYDGDSVSVTERSAPTGTINDDSAVDLVLGNRPAANRTWDGKLADLRMYNRILSADEVKTIYSCRGRDSIRHGLVGQWFLAGEGAPGGAGLSTTPDYAGTGMTGTKTGSPVYQEGPLMPGRRARP